MRNIDRRRSISTEVSLINVSANSRLEARRQHKRKIVRARLEGDRTTTTTA